MNDYHFTSESVSEGHPDKVADQISDAILDAVLDQDPYARVAAETLVSTNLVVLAGEITANTEVNYEQITRDTIANIGYATSDMGFDAQTCDILIHYDKQSPDIARGIIDDTQKLKAADQGMVFGYACNETPTYMPFPIDYAHRLMKQQSKVRKEKVLPWLKPDAKSQITCVYDKKNGHPKWIDTVVLSTQHSEEVSLKTITEGVMEEIIKPVLPDYMITPQTRFFINPTGRFVIGGPKGDCGLTGRKIIVDTYGGAAPHGGGAFSGKDPSKMDRSSAYMARYIAKNIVAAGIANKCQIQIAYAIGVCEPISIALNTFDSNVIPNEKIINLIKNNFDLTPEGIIETLKLRYPIYKNTAAYGHFGRNESWFTWENTDYALKLHELAELP